MLIKAEAVTRVYSNNSIEHPALRGIDLEIEKGDFLVLAGPSGSGKTTLLNLLGTLDSPTSGRIVLKDRDISELGDNEKADLRLRSIGFVFQAYNLVNVLSADENVQYVLQLQGMPLDKRKARSYELLESVGLEGMEKRRPEELSGGQQQRVAVARALASEPELILADEPTANLDQETGKGLMELMLHLNRDLGQTFVISSHDEMVIGFARRLVRLLDGKVISDEKVNH